METGLTAQCARDRHDDCWLQLTCECDCHELMADTTWDRPMAEHEAEYNAAEV